SCAWGVTGADRQRSTNLVGAVRRANTKLEGRVTTKATRGLDSGAEVVGSAVRENQRALIDGATGGSSTAYELALGGIDRGDGYSRGVFDLESGSRVRERLEGSAGVSESLTGGAALQLNSRTGS